MENSEQLPKRTEYTPDDFIFTSQEDSDYRTWIQTEDFYKIRHMISQGIPFKSGLVHTICKKYIDVACSSMPCMSMRRSPETYAKILRIFISAGINVNALNNFGETPVEIAIKHKQFGLLDVLCEGGAILYDDIVIFSFSAIFLASLLGFTLNAIKTAFDALVSVISVSVTIPISDKIIFGFTSSCLI